MSYEPTPREALLLWRLITAETDEEREPMLKNTRPSFTKAQCQRLVAERFLTLESKHSKRGTYLVLGEGAWAWAERATNVKILKSQSSVGAEALQGLLRRLLPFLREHELPLASLFSPAADAGASQRIAAELNAAPVARGDSLPALIEAACLALGGARKARVRLTALRRELASVERDVLDNALLQLSDQGRLVLYRDDNSGGLTEEDHRAALTVGGAPRHLVYLEG